MYMHVQINQHKCGNDFGSDGGGGSKKKINLHFNDRIIEFELSRKKKGKKKEMQ